MNAKPNCVILESQNDADLSQGDLDELVTRIRVQLRDAKVDDLTVAAVAHDALGVGNHLSDVLNVFVPSSDGVKDVVLELILGQIKSMMLARFSRKHEQLRPRVIVIRNAQTGEVERVLRATTVEGEFVEVDAEVADSRRPPPLRLTPPD